MGEVGQVPNVIFLEGAVQNTAWTVSEVFRVSYTGYYGAADTRVGAAKIDIIVAPAK